MKRYVKLFESESGPSVTLEELYYLCVCSKISPNGRRYEVVNQGATWPEMDIVETEYKNGVLTAQYPRTRLCEPHTGKIDERGFMVFCDNFAIDANSKTVISYVGDEKTYPPKFILQGHSVYRYYVDPMSEDHDEYVEESEVTIRLDFNLAKFAQIDMSVLAQNPFILSLIANELKQNLHFYFMRYKMPNDLLDALVLLFKNNIGWVSDDFLLKLATPQEVRKFKRKIGMGGMFGKR
jgi:hypothetical protein